MKNLEKLLSTLAVGLTITILVGAVPTAAATSADTRCKIAKLRAVTTHHRARLGCYKKALAADRAVDTRCLFRARGILAEAFGRAEARGECSPSVVVVSALDERAADQMAFAILAVEAPAPTPLPEPTPPSGAICGNGVVEPGEVCDGELFCTPTCEIAEPTGCCQTKSAPDYCGNPTGVDEGICFQSGLGGGYAYEVAGGTCAEQGPPVGVDDVTPYYAGACEPTASFPALSMCCQMPGSCVESSVASTIDVAQFQTSCESFPNNHAQVGTCSSGVCIPG